MTTKEKIFIVISFTLLIALVTSVKIKSDRVKLQLSRLVTDAHVVVGDVSLVLPHVALRVSGMAGYSFSLNRDGDRQRALEVFYQESGFNKTAPILNKIEISLHTYGWKDSDPTLAVDCEKLSRLWSKSICNDPWAALRFAMPYSGFYFVDDRHFEVFDNFYTVAGGKRSDQLRAMVLSTGQVSISCDQEFNATTKFCTAAIQLQNHLTAVWSVWDKPTETAEDQSKREGQAIAAFLTHSISQSENFPAVWQMMCRLRRPDSSVPPRLTEHPCDGPDFPRHLYEAAVLP